MQITGISTDIDSSLDQLASRARYNEVDAVIYIQDPTHHDYGRPNTLLMACDANNIPYASNLASAELLVLAIDRGDLDWRELVRLRALVQGVGSASVAVDQRIADPSTRVLVLVW